MSSEYGIIRRKGCRRHPTVACFAGFKPFGFALGLNTRVPLIINNFYDEYNGDSLYFSNLLFLGMTLGPINLLNFKMENGKHIKRQIGDTMHYVETNKTKNNGLRCDATTISK